MKVRKIAGTCDFGTCPTVYLSERGTVVVQGYVVREADGLTLSEGEQAVEIPFDLLGSAVKGLT